MASEKGILLVVSGPSGSGKGTVIGRLMELREDFVYSVSATTRTPRDGEKNGVNYWFLTKDEFERRIDGGMMLEWAEYCGNYYGTPKKEVIDSLENGKNVILEIEVQGALQVRKKFPEAVLLMITPPDFRTLESRLRGRGDKVPEEVILKRLDTAKSELAHIGEYDYLVINDEIDKAASQIIGVVDSEKCRVSRRAEVVSGFFA